MTLVIVWVFATSVRISKQLLQMAALVDQGIELDRWVDTTVLSSNKIGALLHNLSSLNNV